MLTNDSKIKGSFTGKYLQVLPDDRDDYNDIYGQGSFTMTGLDFAFTVEKTGAHTLFLRWAGGDMGGGSDSLYAVVRRDDTDAIVPGPDIFKPKRIGIADNPGQYLGERHISQHSACIALPDYTLSPRRLLLPPRDTRVPLLHARHEAGELRGRRRLLGEHTRTRHMLRRPRLRKWPALASSQAEAAGAKRWGATCIAPKGEMEAVRKPLWYLFAGQVRAAPPCLPSPTRPPPPLPPLPLPCLSPASPRQLAPLLPCLPPLLRVLDPSPTRPSPGPRPRVGRRGAIDADGLRLAALGLDLRGSLHRDQGLGDGLRAVAAEGRRHLPPRALPARGRDRRRRLPARPSRRHAARARHQAQAGRHHPRLPGRAALHQPCRQPRRRRQAPRARQGRLGPPRGRRRQSQVRRLPRAAHRFEQVSDARAALCDANLRQRDRGREARVADASTGAAAELFCR